MGKKHPVRVIFGRTITEYSVEDQKKPEWQKVLQDAHQKANVECLCFGEGDKSLSIRPSVLGNFYLARFPKKGHFHHKNCKYYDPDPDKSGLGAYTDDVIEVTEDGFHILKLSLSLDAKEPADNKVEDDIKEHNKDGTIRTKKRAIKLLGLLNHIWNEAQFNKWTKNKEGKRNLNVIGFHTLETSRHLKIKKLVLSKVLLCPTNYSKDSISEHNRDAVRYARKNNKRMIAIAQLAKYSQGKERCLNDYNSLSIVGYQGYPHMTVSEPLYETLEKSFQRELAAWRTGAKVIAITQLSTPNQRNVAEVLNIALMRVSSEWIPVASGLEELVEEKLRKEGRNFTKPLRYDAEEKYFPDFILLDVPGVKEYVMEVFGMNTENYIKRKIEKIRIYNDLYGERGWWYWDARKTPTIDEVPSFPKAYSD